MRTIGSWNLRTHANGPNQPPRSELKPSECVATRCSAMRRIYFNLAGMSFTNSIRTPPPSARQRHGATALTADSLSPKQYGLNSNAVRLRRGYYAGRPTSRFRAENNEVLVIWNDEIGRRLGGKKARLSAIADRMQQMRQRCIPAFEEVTLPREVILHNVHVRAVAVGSAWTFIDDKIETRFDRIGPSTLRLPDDALRKISTA